MSEQAVQKRVPEARHGVDTPNLFATIDAVRENRDLAKFKFRATNQWIRGTHCRSTIESFDGAGGTHEQTANFQYDADHPPVLCGEGSAPTPVEHLLHALAACLTAGLANIAAARGITLRSVESSVEGDMDLQGILGLSDDVRNGYQGIRVRFKVDADAPEDKIRKLVDQATARSAVYDVFTNGIPVEISLDA